MAAASPLGPAPTTTASRSAMAHSLPAPPLRRRRSDAGYQPQAFADLLQRIFLVVVAAADRLGADDERGGEPAAGARQAAHVHLYRPGVGRQVVLAGAVGPIEF